MEHKEMLLEELRNIYQINKDQLIFAESKNGALLVFNMAALAIFSYSGKGNICFEIIPVAGFVISCIISFLSFAPLTYDVRNIHKIDIQNSSIIYFRNIASYDPNDYLTALCEQMGCPSNCYTDYSITSGYAQEIIVLAKITVLKNRAFRTAMWISVFSLLTVTVGICVSLLSITSVST